LTAIGAHNLARLADDALGRHGDRSEALWFEGRWYSSGELYDRMTRVAAGLTGLGVAAGDRVVVFMANAPEVGVVYQAIWRAGAVATPTIFLLPPQELQHVLSDSGAKVVVTTPEFLPTALTAAEGVGAVEHIVCLDLEDPSSVEGPCPVHAMAELEDSDPAPIVPRGDDDLAGLLYTGGTTGRSKGVMQSHAAFWHMAKAAGDHTRVDGITRSLTPLPLSHAYGLGVAIAAGHEPEPLTSVLMRWFDPVGALGLIAEHRIERTFMVPSMIQLLLAQDLDAHDLSSLRYIASGAAPLAPEVIHAFEERLPGVQVLEGYGLTESATFVSANQYDNRKVGTVGLPFPGVDVRTVDDDGSPADPGELIVRSPGVMQGYWDDPDATTAALTDDGWLRTGDVATIDEDGFITIIDRKKDVIIRGGFNVYPRDVEDALMEHPAVAMAGVVGQPDRDKGEEVVAFVQPVPGADLDPDDVVAWARDRLGGYRYPRIVHVVDALPLTPVMKLDRKALRARL
jgi:long-chain acyl-CoA synthetase